MRLITILLLFSLVSCSVAPTRSDLDRLHPKLRRIYANEIWGKDCESPTYCGEMVNISCAPEVDGPDLFYDNKTATLVMACGGSCMGRSNDPKTCQACPPKGWTCPSGYASEEEQAKETRYTEGRKLQEINGEENPYEMLVQTNLSANRAKIFEECKDEVAVLRSKRASAFIGISAIDAAGRVTDVVIFGDDLPCIEASIERLELPKPPSSPFYSMFRVGIPDGAITPSP